MARKRKVPPRSRPRSLDLDRDTLANHIHDSLRQDLDDRNDWNEMRIQRYAKLRGWRADKQFPWPGASNAHLPFLSPRGRSHGGAVDQRGQAKGH
jgi:hypothetical protein